MDWTHDDHYQLSLDLFGFWRGYRSSLDRDRAALTKIVLFPTLCVETTGGCLKRFVSLCVVN